VPPIEIVYDQGIPPRPPINRSSSHSQHATGRVLHFGYAPNDIAFPRNVRRVGVKFKMLFCIYPGLETELLERTSVEKGLTRLHLCASLARLPRHFCMKHE